MSPITVFIDDCLFKSSIIIAISMPTDLDRCNQLIIKRIINISDFNENGRSDTSCYRR